MRALLFSLLFLGLSSHLFSNVTVTGNVTLGGGSVVYSWLGDMNGLGNKLTNVAAIQLQSTQLGSDNNLTNGNLQGYIEYSNHTFFATTYKVRRSIALGQNIVLNDLVVSNTTSETTLYSITMAANYLTAGKVIEPNLDGIYTQASGPGTRFVIRAYIAGQMIVAMPGAVSTTAAALPWDMSLRLTCRTNGSSSAIMAKGRTQQGTTAGGGGTTTIMDALTAPVIFDGTTNNTLTITVSNTTAAAGFTLQQGRTLCIDSVPGQ